jgi:N-acetylneuraminate synthase
MRSRPVYIIAEAGVNHNGSLQIARKLIDAAAAAGVDAVKFQTFKAEKLVSGASPKAEYQKARTNANESQFDMLKTLELDEKAHVLLAGHCRKRNIRFLSTPFDEDSIGLLATRIGVPLLKLPSGEITNGPLLLCAAQTRLPVILSTGMSTLADIRAALSVLAFGYAGAGTTPSRAALRTAFSSAAGQRWLRKKVTLLHCTTEYPAPFSDVNLRAMDTMRDAFGLPVGLSDHTTGVSVPIAAVARGACVIEKHFTLDRKLPGPDHQASLEPSELRAMVEAIRNIERALGTGQKKPARSEKKNMLMARRSIVAARDIAQGEVLTRENLTCKRPGNGMSPLLYWDLLGEKAARRYPKDARIVR